MKIEDHMTDEERLCLNVAREHDKRMAAQAETIRTVSRQPLTREQILQNIDACNELAAQTEIRDIAVKFLMEHDPDVVAQIMTATLADRGNEFSNGALKALQNNINDICWERV